MATRITRSQADKPLKNGFEGNDKLFIKEWSKNSSNSVYSYNPLTRSLLIHKNHEKNLVFLSVATLVNSFVQFFLPLGYPRSVRSDYGLFQLYDSLQGVCSYLRGLLCTSAVLIGLGVGNSSANITSATVNWLFRDGVGLFTGLVFGSYGSQRFGYEIKQWRLTADLANDVGLTLELLSPIYPPLFLYLLSAAIILKTICGVTAGATKAALMQHFALANNVADLSTKENMQETFITMIGMVAGYVATHLIANNQFLQWLIFLILTLLHVVFNILAMRSLRLTTLNYQRAQLIIEMFGSSKRNHDRITPTTLAAKETIYFSDRSSVRVVFAASLLDLADNFSAALSIQPKYNNLNYLIYAHNNLILVSYSTAATSQDKLQSILHAFLLQKALLNNNSNHSLQHQTLIAASVKEQFNSFHSLLLRNGWDCTNLAIDTTRHTYDLPNY
jgi:hypothetical protein